MKLTFAIIYVCWFISEVVLGRLRRSGDSEVKRDDRHSLTIIWIVIAVFMPMVSILPSFVSVPILHSTSIVYVGLCLIVVGMLLRFWAIRSLGRFFTVDVSIREGHTLKTDGLYAVVRHPSYFASWLSFIGYGLSLNNWLSLVIISATVLGAFLNRISVEEDVLISQFGEEYIRFRKSTKTIIPGIY